MMYRHIATSKAGFVQQLAVGYVNHGYWFYVTGCVPDHKQPELINQKLIEKYDIAVSKWARARRKRQGQGNVHYLRYDEFFVLIATKGVHRIFEEERTVIRDIRREPIHFAGYSIGYKQGCDGKWHPSVRIHPVEYKALKAHCLEVAVQQSTTQVAEELQRLPFEPYAPVRRQLLCILRAVNKARKRAGFIAVDHAALRLRRRPVPPDAGTACGRVPRGLSFDRRFRGQGVREIGMMEQFYSACCHCTAKWFSRQKLPACPRCGSEEVQHTWAIPPWALWAERSKPKPAERPPRSRKRPSGA